MEVGRSARPSSIAVLGVFLAGGLAAALGAVLLLVAQRISPGNELLRAGGLAGILVGVALVTVGLGFEVFRPIRLGRGATLADFGSHRVVLSATAFATLLGVLLGNILPLLVLSWTGQRGLRNVPGVLSAALSVSLVLLAVGYFRFIRPGAVSPGDFGFGRNRQAPRFFGQVWLAHLATGFGGWLLVFLASAGIQALLHQLGVEQTQLREYAWVAALPPVDFTLVVLAGAVVGPLAEEIFFRGLIFRLYLQARGPLVAYLVSSAVFALLHVNLPALAPIFVLGLVLAWLYRSTGSLTPGLLAHALNNGVAFMVLRYNDQLRALGGG